MTITELRQKRAEAWERAKAYLDERGQDGVLSEEDATTYARMEQEVNDLGTQVERMERREALDRQMSEPVNQAMASRPDQARSADSPRAQETYNSAFWTAMRGRADYDAYNVLQIGEDADGGYLVPDEFERQIIDALNEQNIMRGLCRVIRTESGERKIPVVASHGTAQWTGENEDYHESDDTFSQVTLGANKLTRLIKCSEELMKDSAFSVEAYLAAEFARSFGAAEEEAFLVGDGTNQPTGVLETAQTGATTASATAVIADEVIDLYYSLRAPYRKRATFLVNDAAVKAIRKLKDGNGQYLWQPALTANTPDMILGRPVRTSAYMPAIAAGNKFMAFGDFSYYWIADRATRTFRRLNELYATKGQVGFIGSQRVDGKLILPEAVKVLAAKAS